MKSIRIGITVALLLAWTIPVQAQSITALGDQAMDMYDFDPNLDFTPSVQGIPDMPVHGGTSIYDFENKSPAKAFVYSLLIPGMGQFYTGSKVKGIIFLGVEVLGWAAWATYRSRGGSKVDQYETFANDHWSDGPYWDSLLSHRSIDKWQDGQYPLFAHHLPFEVNGIDTVANKNHEYYENVGKYDQFVWGWDDLQQIESPIDGTNPEVSFLSNRRGAYVLMREDANTSYDRARAFGIVLIANHVISALEAAFSAKSYNRRTQQASRFKINLQMVNIEDTPTPWVNVALRF